MIQLSIIQYLIQGMGLGIYAGILPGPTQAFILTKTIVNGWRRTMPLAFVPLLSDLPIALAAIFLLSTFPMVLIDLVQILGGIYLVYLSFLTVKLPVDKSIQKPEKNSSIGFCKTIGINLGNPNVYIFWTTIGAPNVLKGWEISPITGISFIVGMYSALVFMVALSIIVFGLTGRLPEQGKKWLIRILALIVCIFGVTQIANGIHGFVKG